MKKVLDFVLQWGRSLKVQYILSVFAFAPVYQLHYLHPES